MSDHRAIVSNIRAAGRLVQHDAGRISSPLLAADLAFANELVLAPDGSHLLYAESGRYQISRFWLTGPKRGSSDPFHTNLPGFPDNMSLGSDGLLWAPRRAAQCAARCTAPLPGCSGSWFGTFLTGSSRRLHR